MKKALSLLLALLLFCNYTPRSNAAVDLSYPVVLGGTVLAGLIGGGAAYGVYKFFDKKTSHEIPEIEEILTKLDHDLATSPEQFSQSTPIIKQVISATFIAGISILCATLAYQWLIKYTHNGRIKFAQHTLNSVGRQQIATFARQLNINEPFDNADQVCTHANVILAQKFGAQRSLRDGIRYIDALNSKVARALQLVHETGRIATNQDVGALQAELTALFTHLDTLKNTLVASPQYAYQCFSSLTSHNNAFLRQARAVAALATSAQALYSRTQPAVSAALNSLRAR